MPPSTSRPSGVSPIWPAANTNPPVTIAWLYGAPWNGAGARSVRTAALSLMRFLPGSRTGSARLGERDAERLEDRLEDVLRVRALDQPDVDDQACALGQAAQEPCGEVDPEAADPRGREVGVRGHERVARALEDDRRERLVRGHRPGAEAPGVHRIEEWPERPAERPAGLVHLGLRLVGRELEREVEASRGREQRDEVVEDRQAGLDARLAAVEADACCLSGWHRRSVALRQSA